jgi:hypothetical protein
MDRFDIKIIMILTRGEKKKKNPKKYLNIRHPKQVIYGSVTLASPILRKY